MPTLPPPRATYRIQAHGDFGFDRIAELASYLDALGISHVYLSPVLTAAPGSQHGYDVIDHEHVNPELGGDAAHQRMCDALQAHGLSQLLDIVPNHMAITGQNRLWWDVLENGPSSHYAAFFDVDWEGGNDTRVLLPILGEHYIDTLQQNLVRVVRNDGEFVVQYHDHRLPAAPRSLGGILRTAAPEHEELCFLADALDELPTPSSVDRDVTLRRQRDKAVLFTYLARLLEADPTLCSRIDVRLEQLNHNVEELDAWLERQNWRLAHWHNATTDLGYRRFFDVNSLAGLRIEDQRVFERVHRVVLRWLAQSVLAGVRVDHVDGLRDPLQYLQRLRQAAPDAWIVVEKILEAHEALPSQWPCDGTTGYEFIRTTDQLFVDRRGQTALTELDERWTGVSDPWDARVLEAKQQILREVLASERERLTDLAQRVLTKRVELRDCTRRTIASAIGALLVSYPVYRSYVRVGTVAEHEREVIADVIKRAAALRPEIDPRVFTALERVLSLQWPGEAETELALRVQQVTGAIMAKAIEDTLFYRHSRLLALNEVGGSPDTFGLTVDEFHDILERSHSPLGILSSATHDTKRGEDTRARLLALSELPELWAQATQRWSQRTQSYRPERLDTATEYFFYQTIVGTYPLSVERALQYMQKAMREAKRETSWIRPDTDYEAAVEGFIRSVCEDRELQDDIGQFVARIAHGGYVTSLSRTLIKLTAPGVPDLYQGTELWDFSLVDPDNRSPVDFAARRELLEGLPRATPESVMAELERGTPKLWLIWKTLGLRKQRPELFTGAYQRLAVEGPDSEHVVAFARGDKLITVVPRLNAHGDPKQRSASVRLPAGRFRNVLTDEIHERAPVATSELWARFPVALLVKES
ncbi:MAG: malto-oligosyltrehalose synthase [Polyangiales bacterium]